MKLPAEIQRQIRKIELDNTSGAVQLTKQAASVFQLFAKTMPALSRPIIFNNNLAAFSRCLIDAQPMMASIVRLANVIMFAADRATEKNNLAAIVRGTCREFLEELHSSSELIASRTAMLLNNSDVVVTHSFSSTVLHALLHARKKGKRFEVICTESRPMREGVLLAKKLGSAGIQTTLIADAAVFSFVREASFVLIGADSLCSQGVVNKIGSFGIALAARSSKIPFYVACGSQKFLPRLLRPRMNRGDSSELLRQRLPRVKALNLYFDLTPLSFVAKVVTEQGVISSPECNRILKSIRIHKLLYE